ncbi:ATP-binding protein, partial [Mycobacterium tuberculosis]|nr:ATP-binding protein [Mycobacterium tuberculosis]
DQEPGRFLLTGSANLATVPAIADSLAGRMAVIPLLPFAQCELAGTPGNFRDRLVAGDDLQLAARPVTGQALSDTVLRGGYPEVVRRSSP